jgi:hypothetical protein
MMMRPTETRSDGMRRIPYALPQRPGVITGPYFIRLWSTEDSWQPWIDANSDANFAQRGLKWAIRHLIQVFVRAHE